MSSAVTGLAVLVAQQVLEQDLQREGQPRDVELRLQRVEPEDLVGLAADLEVGAGVEGVLRHALQTSPRPPRLSAASVSEPPSKRTSTGSEPPAGTRHDSVERHVLPRLDGGRLADPRALELRALHVQRPRVEAVREVLGEERRRAQCAALPVDDPHPLGGRAHWTRRRKRAQKSHQRPCPPHPNANVHLPQHYSQGPCCPRLLAASFWPCSLVPAAASASAARPAPPVPLRADDDQAGPEHDLVDGDKTRARGVAGWIVGFRPEPRAHDGKIPRVDVIHLHHARLAHQRPADVRRRRGEDERQAAAPASAGATSPSDRWVLNHMIHNLLPNRARSTSPTTIDFIPDSLAGREGDAARSRRAGSTSRAAARTRSSTSTAAAARDGRFTYPDDEPDAYGGGPRATRRSIPRDGVLVGRPPGTCTRAASTPT